MKAAQPMSAQRMAILLGALSTFPPLATDMYLSSFPSLAAHFHTNVGRVQQTLSVYVLGLALGQLLYGPLIDRVGRRGPLLGGIALFVVSAGLSPFVANIESLIALRLLQAVGGVAGIVVGRAVIRDLYPEHESARVLSMTYTVQSAGPIVAPVLGAYLLSVSNWQSIFVFLAAFGALCLVGAALALPETLPPERRHGGGATAIVRAFGLLLRQRRFIVPALASATALGCVFSFISASPFVFMELHGATARQYGWLFAFNATGIVLGAQLNGHLLARYSPRRLLGVGFGVNVAAAITLLALADRSTMWAVTVPLWFVVGSIPLIIANASAIALAATGEHVGSASALIGVLQFGCGSAAGAIVGVLHNGTAYPMAGSITVCALAGGALYLFGMRTRKDGGAH